jgi:hypothetical protein
MARLRLVGRPRHRYVLQQNHKNRVESERVDNTLIGTDPKTCLLVNIQRGLKCFSELAGQSDEVSYLQVNFAAGFSD